MVASPIIGLAFLAIALLLLLGAFWVSLRGVGGISTLRSELMVLRTHLEQLDTRITREVKTRAGLASAEKAQEERTVLEQAEAELRIVPTPPANQNRPKRQFRRK